MKSRSAHWVYLLLGFLWIAGVTYWYLTFLRGYCIHDILQDKSALGKINRHNFMVDLAYIPGSLLVTALLFYLAGRNWFTKFFGNENKVGIKDLGNSNNQEELIKELEDCKKKYDDLLIKSSGDKIEKKNISSSLGATSAAAAATSSSSETKSTGASSGTSSIDDEIEAKKQELQAQQSKTSAAKAPESTSSASTSKASSSNAGDDNFDKAKAKEVFGKAIKYDDLKLVEGIGPKIESILKSKGISTWAELAQTDPQKIVDILLEEGGAAYKIHDPSTWPKQAKLAAEGQFDELKSLQDNLKGGREV